MSSYTTDPPHTQSWHFDIGSTAGDHACLRDSVM